MVNPGLENKEISYKGDIDSGNYDDADFNSDLDAINSYNRMINLKKEDIFKIQTQYNFKVKHNLINIVTEFYNIHGYGNYELGRRAVKRIVDTKTIGEWYISKRYTNE